LFPYLVTPPFIVVSRPIRVVILGAVSISQQPYNAMS
jgi:hypothetical protein